MATPPPPSDPCRDGQLLCIAPSTVKNKVDILFVLDDAPSMGVKLATFRAALPQLIGAFDDDAQLGSPVAYHLGVVTADLGAGPAALPQFGCRPGGDGAKLRDAGGSGGVRFIDDNQIAGTTNVSDVTAALTALADVGTAGCAFRSPLEAAYRALHDQIPENVAFLRSDALLAIVFVSDADDCSAPFTTDLFDASAAGVTKYGALDPFRCTQFGIACDGMPVPPTSISGLTGCVPQTMADGGKLIDVDRYLDFFNKPAAQGGVKVDPGDVILVGLTGPSDPVGVTVDAMQPVLNHSCLLPTDARFFGDPAVRLRSVIGAAKHNNKTSICDTDFTAAINALGDLIGSALGAGCLSSPIANRADGTPDCVVTDVTANPDGSTTTMELASCAENGHVVPCWQEVDTLAQYQQQGCTPTAPSPSTCELPITCQPVTNPVDGKQQLVTISIDRGLDSSGKPNTAPPGTTANISCASGVQ
ncbi:MAG: hypothetical protein JWM53_4256 [bacterium]|nr:hypothetical protein [bacterium]